jgi:hypothetical protein
MISKNRISEEKKGECALGILLMRVYYTLDSRSFMNVLCSLDSWFF